MLIIMPGMQILPDQRQARLLQQPPGRPGPKGLLEKGTSRTCLSGWGAGSSICQLSAYLHNLHHQKRLERPATRSWPLCGLWLQLTWHLLHPPPPA